MTDTTDRYADLPTETPMGAPLDWLWLKGAKSEWGVQPKPGPRGLTMMDIAVGKYGEVPEVPAQTSDLQARSFEQAWPLANVPAPSDFARQTRPQAVPTTPCEPGATGR